MKPWLGFGIQQIRDPFTFLFLLTHIRLNFFLSAWIIKVIMKIYIHHVFFFQKNGLVRLKENVLQIVLYFASAQ